MKQTIELHDTTVDVLHELILRGLAESDATKREYGEAYDAFVEAADYPVRIGDQPERVQEVWQEIIEDTPYDPRQDR